MLSRLSPSGSEAPLHWQPGPRRLGYRARAQRVSLHALAPPLSASFVRTATSLSVLNKGPDPTDTAPGSASPSHDALPYPFFPPFFSRARAPDHEPLTAPSLSDPLPPSRAKPLPPVVQQHPDPSFPPPQVAATLVPLQFIVRLAATHVNWFEAAEVSRQLLVAAPPAVAGVQGPADQHESGCARWLGASEPLLGEGTRLWLAEGTRVWLQCRSQIGAGGRPDGLEIWECPAAPLLAPKLQQDQYTGKHIVATAVRMPPVRAHRPACARRLRPPRWRLLAPPSQVAQVAPSILSALHLKCAKMALRASRRVQGQKPAAVTIASPGDDLLAKCFSLLDQSDL